MRFGPATIPILGGGRPEFNQDDRAAHRRAPDIAAVTQPPTRVHGGMGASAELGLVPKKDDVLALEVLCHKQLTANVPQREDRAESSTYRRATAASAGCCPRRSSKARRLDSRLRNGSQDGSCAA